MMGLQPMLLIITRAHEKPTSFCSRLKLAKRLKGRAPHLFVQLPFQEIKSILIITITFIDQVPHIMLRILHAFSYLLLTKNPSNYVYKPISQMNKSMMKISRRSQRSHRHEVAELCQDCCHIQTGLPTLKLSVQFNGCFFLTTSHKIETSVFFFGLFTQLHSKNVEILVGCPWRCLYKLCRVGAGKSFGNMTLKVCMNMIDCRPQKRASLWQKVQMLLCVSAGWSGARALSVLPGQPFSECETLTFSSFMSICEKD